jgi:hypothetical protein
VSEFLDLLRDNTSVLGRLVTTAVLVVVAVSVALVAGRLAGRRVDDPWRDAVHVVVSRARCRPPVAVHVPSRLPPSLCPSIRSGRMCPGMPSATRT